MAVDKLPRPDNLPKLELIEWVDSTSPGASVWMDNHAVRELTPQICYSVGFVVKETRAHITVAGSWSENQASGTMCIPKKAIQRRAKLRV
jgi:hypothetical protein